MAWAIGLKSGFVGEHETAEPRAHSSARGQ